MTSRPARSEPFFLIYGWVMLVIVVLGFGLRAAVLPESLPPFSWIIVTHAVVMMCWFLLFIAQAGLVRFGNVASHKRAGRASVVLAVALVATGLAVMVEGYEKSGDGLVAMAGLGAMVTFSVLYPMALRAWRDPASHKRFLLLASVRMLVPAFFRICLVLGISEFWTPVFLVAGVVAVVAYDLRRLGGLHRATIVAGSLILITIVLVPTAGVSAGWIRFMDWVAGR